jgi:hypothetical protein
MFVARVAAVAFVPSGMNLNSNFTIPSSYTTMTGFVADTTNYPGSSVVSNGLIVQTTYATATVTANIPWTSSFSETVTVRLLQNGTVIATGTGVAGTSGTSTCTVTGVSVTASDSITAQIVGTQNNFGTATAGTNCYVRVTT